MAEQEILLVEGQLIDDRSEISGHQLCRSCAIELKFLERLISEGILEPSRSEGEIHYFPHSSLLRTRTVVRLRADLGVNLAGAALALELLDRIDLLEARLKMR